MPLLREDNLKRYTPGTAALLRAVPGWFVTRFTLMFGGTDQEGS